MASKTYIGNLALLRLDQNQLMGDIDTDNSQAARTLKAIFNAERDYILRSFPWPWATTYEALGLVSDPDEALNDDWYHAYRYPSGCLFARRLVTALGRQPATPVEFKVGRDDDGRLIYTNEEDAILEYTVRIEDAEEFDPTFVSLLAWRLAMTAGPSITRDVKLVEAAMRMYFYELSLATATAANEGQQPAPLDAPWIAER